MLGSAKIAVEAISSDDANFLTLIEEGHFADVKAREIAPAKLTKTISAFANTAGGDIYIGIAEEDRGDTKPECGLASMIKKRPTLFCK